MRTLPYRIGQIVQSSNTTMESEIPAILRAREAICPERFTFHSSRMRMHKVTEEGLEGMDRDSLRCSAELADARVDVMGYACLVAIMSMGPGHHRKSQAKLEEVARDKLCFAAVVSAAGALVDGLGDLGARKVSIVAPYMKPLTDCVVAYLEAESIEVVDAISLEMPNNLEVGRRAPLQLIEDVKRLNIEGIDAVVLSACVQMPSLAAIEPVQDLLGLPVTSSAVCTARSMLLKLGLEPVAPGAGALLSGRFAQVARAA